MPDSEWPVAFPCESVPLGLACWAMRIERQVPQRGASRVTPNQVLVSFGEAAITRRIIADSE